MNFVDYLFDNVKDPLKSCIHTNKDTLTYRDLNSHVAKLATYLNTNLGFGKECLLISENSIFFVICYLAIIKSGNVALLVETRIPDDQLTRIISESKIQISFVQKKLCTNFINISNVFTDDNLNQLPDDGACNIPNIVDNDTAVVIFTSGSTGTKKGVMLTHKNLCVNTESIIQYLDLNSEDRICATLPFFYCYGASLLHTHLRVGGSIVISDNIFLGGVIRDINTHSCTGFAGVPSTYQILINKTPFLKEKLPTLRYMTQAGGQLQNKYIQQICEAFPEKKFFVMYGATEATARLSYLPPHLVLTKLGSIGMGIPGVILEVLDENGKPVKPGETGEIVARGDNIMKGYYGDPETTNSVIHENRLFTGDLATVDNDGYIYIVGRSKNIIKTCGHRISPNEIEEFICSLEGIIGCVVIGLPDDVMGEAIIAVVHPGGTDELLLKDKILAECRRNLPTYKIPKSIIFVQEFPLNASNKIDKLTLAASIAEKLKNEEE